MTLRRRLRWLVTLLVVAVLAWAAGLVWFIAWIHRPMEHPPRADGIVVLTGGADRIQTALRLLQANQARLLLVSGAGPGVEFTALAHLARVQAAPLADRVTLGHAAASTRGNALETAAWVHRHDIHSLIVVTAFYHMPRALIELRRVLTGVTLYPMPVRPPGLSGAAGQMLALRLEALEYTKFLIAWTGLSSLGPGLEHPGQPP
ncbi:MAG TPA: YdcF family protein [Acetobacteraceae bacterium]